jgi:parvulin-like peptidyl-prolyl isomerase
MTVQNFIIYVTLLLLPIGILPQIVDEGVIAKVGSSKITKQEFIARYELTPQVYAGITGIEEALKKEVLYSIISEKLWALEANELGLATSDLIKYTYKVYEEMYVRDALYRVEILSKVKLSDEYLAEAFRRNSQILQVNYLFSSSPNEIDLLYNQLKEGTPFDSLLAIRPENALQTEPYYVSYGQMDKPVEDILYNLKIGHFTKPVEAPSGWYTFKLLKKGKNLLLNTEQADAEHKKVLKIARTTIIDSIYKEFYEDFFSDVNAETNGAIFHQFADEVVKSLSDRKHSKNVPDGKEIFLKPDDLYRIENVLGEETLNASFIELDDQPAILKEFIQYFAFESFSVDTIDSNMITGKLNSNIKRFIEHKLLSREGYRRGLQNLPEVQRHLKMWMSYYLNDALRGEMIKNIEVTDDELLNYYQRKNKGFAIPEVKIIEVLTDDLDVMHTVLDELKEGIDIRELALKYTIREEAKNNDGELGFFPVTEYGEIGRIASQMEIGILYGPVKIPEGYSLIKVIDRRNKESELIADFEKVKDKLKMELKYLKFSKVIIDKTVELANKYSVEINQALLENLEVTNTTTIFYHYLGFGGRILAVPMTIPNYEWVNPWLEHDTLMP